MSIAVTDVAAAVTWYRRVLEVDGPELKPVEGVVELAVGNGWVQLARRRPAYDGSGTVLRLGVVDLEREHRRPRSLEVPLDPIETVPGVISYLDFVDPDSHQLGFYELAQDSHA